MAELWGRSAKLTFGKSGETGVVIDTSLSVYPNEIPQITFDIKKKVEGKNTGVISIYNLAKTTREIVSQANADELQCELQVGYGGDNFTIFRGSIQIAGSQWSGKEWVTTLEAVDGKKKEKKRVNKSYKKDKDIKEIITETLSNAKEEFKAIVVDVKKERLKKGLTISGTLTYALEKLKNLVPDQNLEVTIQDETIIIKPATSIVNPTNIPVIAFDTGMIGAPKKTQKGVKFECLIQKGIFPGSGIQIKSRDGEYDGIYIVQKCNISGETRGTNWKISGEANLTSKYQIVEEVNGKPVTPNISNIGVA